MNAQRSSGDQSVSLKSPRELETLRAAVRPGITTRELDRVAEQSFKRHSARSGTLNYFGFPGQLCVSVNEEVVHGIPGKRRIKAGDIVKLDVVAVKDGYYGDAAVTIPVGPVRPEVERLIRVTEEATLLGVEQARPGNRLSDISHAIERHVLKHGLK